MLHLYRIWVYTNLSILYTPLMDFPFWARFLIKEILASLMSLSKSLLVAEMNHVPILPQNRNSLSRGAKRTL